jgi:hopanoid biosynthesis associated radical SAM protein HpnH
MGFPLPLVLGLARYLVAKRVRGERRFPLVLMLEPTHRCNLSCAGCGRIREYDHRTEVALRAEDCLASAVEADAPVVAVSGGEPLLHPEIERIVKGLVAQGRFTYLCTNGVLLRQSLNKFTPSPYFSFNVHLDGLADTHDRLTGRPGTFDRAIEAIRVAVEAGFRVCTNTTLYRDTDSVEIIGLISLLMDCGVDGALISPGFSYEAVADDIFLSKEEVHRTFQWLLPRLNGGRLINTPPYRAFLKGERELQCSPWGNPTRTPQGWKQPCYLLTDGYCQSFRQLMEETDWERYGHGRDPRCANCKVHSGYETSAVLSMLRPAAWLRGTLSPAWPPFSS